MMPSTPRYLLPALVVLVSTLGSVQALGQAAPASLEDRLRAELRSVSDQLQRAQAELRQLTAERDQAQHALKSAEQQVERHARDLSRAESQHDRLRDQAAAQISARNERLEEYRAAYDELLHTAREKEQQRSVAENELRFRRAQVEQCTVQNEALYQTGHEVITAFEQLRTRDLLRARQPFATHQRVKLDNLVQEYADSLYGHRYHPAQPLPEAEQATAPAAPTTSSGASQ